MGNENDCFAVKCTQSKDILTTMKSHITVIETFSAVYLFKVSFICHLPPHYHPTKQSTKFGSSFSFRSLYVYTHPYMLTLPYKVFSVKKDIVLPSRIQPWK